MKEAGREYLEAFPSVSYLLMYLSCNIHHSANNFFKMYVYKLKRPAKIKKKNWHRSFSLIRQLNNPNFSIVEMNSRENHISAD